jgi:chaperone modulatory protein CbpM
MSTYHINDLVQIYHLEEPFIHICIKNQWIVPLDSENDILDQEDVGRLFLIKDLQYTLGVNDAAVPVIMDLLDQVYWLRKKAGNINL